jgi:hypothetical protein
MKKKALIVRSVSFQQLDKNMKGITQRFPGYEFHLLTHSHGIDCAQGYASISEVIDYGSRKNFSLFHVPEVLKNLKKKEAVYDVIIVPVTNKTGTGFLNVLLMAYRIRSGTIYICNLVSEIWEVPRAAILYRAFKSFLFSIISTLMTVPLTLVTLPVLLTGFLISRLKKHHPENTSARTEH